MASKSLVVMAWSRFTFCARFVGDGVEQRRSHAAPAIRHHDGPSRPTIPLMPEQATPPGLPSGEKAAFNVISLAVYALPPISSASSPY
jgi:hypothetical protein